MGIDILDVKFRTEKTFGITFPNRSFDEVHTAGDLFELVLETLPTSKLLHESGTCRKCGYDLRGLPEPRCPECGAPFFCEANASREAVWEILLDPIEEGLGVKREMIKPDLKLY